MLGLFWGEWSSRDRIRRVGAVRRGHRPALEGLEPRIALSTDVWTGLGGDDNWMTAGNWSPAVVPSTGDDLDFPAGAAQTTNNNNFPGGMTFNSITIGGSGYYLEGNTLTLNTGISADYSSGSSTIAIDTVLSEGTTPISVTTGGTLVIGPNALSGPVGVSVSGGGTLDLTGSNKYTGETTVTSGTTLEVDGTVDGGVQLNGGGLRGNGTVGTVSSVGGAIYPGHTISTTISPGVLTLTAPTGSTTGPSLTLDSNSVFVTDLDGTTPGDGTTGYSQVVVSAPPAVGDPAGTITLGDATLEVNLDPGYSPSPGDALDIISNQTGSTVTGIFAGLAEGAAVTTTSGATPLFRISYAGGATGNADDVVLTSVSYASTITLSPITTPVTYGQSVTLSANVTGSAGPATGTVEFFNGSPTADGTELASASLVGGVATTTYSGSLLGVDGGASQEIYALYIPTSNVYTYAGSTSAGQSVTVSPATLTVTGVVAENKQYDATTTATISTSSASLVGVIGSDDVSINATNATAQFVTANAGTNIPVTVTGLSLSGAQSGDYILQQPTGLTASITPAPLTLTANSFTIAQGQAIPTLTYTGSGFQGSDTTSSLTTQPTLTTTATTTSAPGTYPIDISGAVDSNYTISYVDGTLTINANYATTTTLTSSDQVAVIGQPITFTATVTPQVSSAGTPTGYVEFIATVSGTEYLLDEAALNSATGQVTFTTSELPVYFQPYAITATYIPTNQFETSTSSTLEQIVTSAGTTETLTLVPVRNKRGRAVRYDLDVQVLPISPGTGTPTGTVTYFINGRATYRTVGLTDGTSTLSFPTAHLGNKYVSVRYNGTEAYIGSTSQSVYIGNRELVQIAKGGGSGRRVLVRRAGSSHPSRS